MDFAFEMGLWGSALLIVASVVFGIAVFLFGNPDYGFEWALTSVAAFVGGFAASEFVVGFRTWEPVVDGLALVPAIVGGIAIGAIVAVAARLLSAEPATLRGT